VTAEAGGGRVRVEDEIDPTVGFLTQARIGDELKQRELIGTVLCADAACGERAAARIQAAYSISEQRPVDLPSLIKEVIE